MSDLLVETPNDILLDGNNRFGPEVQALHSGNGARRFTGSRTRNSMTHSARKVKKHWHPTRS